jgi:hypothetical protein
VTRISPNIEVENESDCKRPAKHPLGVIYLSNPQTLRFTPEKLAQQGGSPFQASGDSEFLLCMESHGSLEAAKKQAVIIAIYE